MPQECIRLNVFLTASGVSTRSPVIGQMPPLARVAAMTLALSQVTSMEQSWGVTQRTICIVSQSGFSSTQPLMLQHGGGDSSVVCGFFYLYKPLKKKRNYGCKTVLCALFSHNTIDIPKKEAVEEIKEEEEQEQEEKENL